MTKFLELKPYMKIWINFIPDIHQSFKFNFFLFSFHKKRASYPVELIWEAIEELIDEKSKSKCI